MTHTVHMSLPIRPGTARRLGLRQPGVWSDTMERSSAPGWGSTNCPAAWTETSGIAADWAVVEPRSQVIDVGTPFQGSLTAAIKPRLRWRQRRNR